jgi:hypothetical protein
VSKSHSPAPDDVTVELKAARWTIQVLSGIGAVVILIALGLLLFVLFPSLPARELTPLSVMLVLGCLAGAIFAAVQLVKGPRMQLNAAGGRVSLIHIRRRKVLATCSIEEASPLKGEARVSGRSGTFRFASIRLEIPGRPPLVVATLDPRFKWEEAEDTWGEPTHWVEAQGWIPLVISLGLRQR